MRIDRPSRRLAFGTGICSHWIRVRGIYQGQADDLIRKEIGEGTNYQPAKGPACQYVGTADPGVDEGLMQFAGAVLGRARVWANLAPTEASAIIGDDASSARQLGLDPMPEHSQTGHTAFEDDGRFVGILTLDQQMQLETACVAENTHRREIPAISLPYCAGLIESADERQPGQGQEQNQQDKPEPIEGNGSQDDKGKQREADDWQYPHDDAKPLCLTSPHSLILCYSRLLSFA